MLSGKFERMAFLNLSPKDVSGYLGNLGATNDEKRRMSALTP